MQHRHRKTRLFLRRWAGADARRTADIKDAISAGPYGNGHEEVYDRFCGEPILQKTSLSGISVRPGTEVPTLHTFGGRGGAVLASSPPGAGGTAVAQEDELAFDLTTEPDEYRALVTDPDTSSLVHVHRYDLEGAYLGELTTISFAGQTDTTPTLSTAIPIKDVPSVPDGFAVLGFSGGNAFLMLANFDPGVVSETQLLDADGNVTSGTLQFDPATGHIYAGGVIDLGPSPDEVRLFRSTLPGLTGTQEVGNILKTGIGAVRFPGVYVPDRWRVPQQSGGSWTTIDSIFLDPTAIPQTVSETADINDNPDGLAAKRIWPLGHNDVDTGWFAWEDSAGIKIWKVGLTGAGSAAGFSDGEYEDDFGPLFYNVGPVDNRWWVFLGMKTPAQPFSTLYPRVSRIQFTGVGVPLPDPVALDGAAAEADQEWDPGDAAPGGIVPWFA